MLREFREFIERFNVLPLAIGFVMASAFAPMVQAMADVVLSVIGAVFKAEVSFDDLTFDLNGTPIPYGSLITAMVTFLIIAWVVFGIVKAVKRAGARTEPAPTPDQALLREIRDLLADRRPD